MAYGQRHCYGIPILQCVPGEGSKTSQSSRAYEAYDVFTPATELTMQQRPQPRERTPEEVVGRKRQLQELEGQLAEASTEEKRMHLQGQINALKR